MRKRTVHVGLNLDSVRCFLYGQTNSEHFDTQDYQGPCPHSVLHQQGISREEFLKCHFGASFFSRLETYLDGKTDKEKSDFLSEICARKKRAASVAARLSLMMFVMASYMNRMGFQ